MDNCVDIDPMDFTINKFSLGRKESNFTATNLVESLVNTNKIVIFSKTTCPHCDDSKSLLNKMGVEYKSIELDKMKEGSMVQNSLAEMTKARTVPRIFINGECVGGNSDLQFLGKNGELKSLLQGRKDSKRNLYSN